MFNIRLNILYTDQQRVQRVRCRMAKKTWVSILIFATISAIVGKSHNLSGPQLFHVQNKGTAVMDPKISFPKFPRTGNPTLVSSLRRRQANFAGPNAGISI